LLLRTFLELSTYLFLKRLNEIDMMRAEAQAAQGKNLKSDWAPDLRPMLQRIVIRHLVNDSHILKSLNLHLNDKQYKPVLAQLNNFVHNPTYPANEPRLREIWEDLSPLLQVVNAS
jgi:hypothetical protein